MSMTEQETAELIYAAGQFDSRNLPATETDALAKAAVWHEALGQRMTLRDAAKALSAFYRYGRDRMVQPGDLIERVEADRPMYTDPADVPRSAGGTQRPGPKYVPIPDDFWEQASLAATPPYQRADGSYMDTAGDFMAEANRRRKAAGLDPVGMSPDLARVLR